MKLLHTKATNWRTPFHCTLFLIQYCQAPQRRRTCPNSFNRANIQSRRASEPLEPLSTFHYFYRTSLSSSLSSLLTFLTLHYFLFIILSSSFFPTLPTFIHAQPPTNRYPLCHLYPTLVHLTRLVLPRLHIRDIAPLHTVSNPSH